MKREFCLFLVLLLLALVPPARGQDWNNDSDPAHPLRLKRHTDAPEMPESHRRTADPLQGGVTSVDVVDGRSSGNASSPQRKPGLKGIIDELMTPELAAGSIKGGNAPPQLYRAWLEKAHPEFSLSAVAMDSNRLVVVYGKYDDTGRTLDSLGLRFDTISARDLDTYDLSRAKVLVIDCPGELSLPAMLKIRAYVASGGYLFTTDWLLDRLDARVFPGYIAWNGAMNKQRMYDATIVGQDPVLFKNTVTNANWKMDIHCHLIRVLNKNAVRVLAISHSLMADDPDHQGVLAVVFPFGRGYVMHMTAHFDRSQGAGYYLPDPAPGIGISLRQALAINYVVAGLSGTKL